MECRFDREAVSSYLNYMGMDQYLLIPFLVG